MDFKETVETNLVTDTTGDTSSDEVVQPVSHSNEGAAAGQQSYPVGYSNFQPIAEGATGRVFAAVSDRDRTSVAVKIYKKELVPDSDAAKRFQHEIKTLGRIEHPNIVKIFDYGETPSGLSYLVMELVEGSNLRSILETDGVLEPKRAAKITREICRALECLHDKGIIHRDIKPNNIVLDSATNVARIVDFGIAKVLNAKNETITQYGTILGTPAYMSPEQCLGQPVDARSDVYALGCTLFEMITGCKAFDDATAMEALAKQIDDDRSFLEKPLISAGVPTDLRLIIMTCLKRNPVLRYASVAELSHEIGAFLLNKPLELTKARAAQAKKPVTTGSAFSVKSAADFLVRWPALTCVAAVLLAFVLIQLSIESLNKSAAYYSKRPPVGLPPYVIYNRKTRQPMFSDPSATDARSAVLAAAKKHVSLQYADLAQVQLERCNLSDIDFRYADLRNANFTYSILHGVNLKGAILHNASFIEANIEPSCDLSAAQLVRSNLDHVSAADVSFEGSDLSYARMYNGNFQNTNFTYADLSNVQLGGTDFIGADLSYANFLDTHINSSRVKVQNTLFTGAKNLIFTSKY